MIIIRSCFLLAAGLAVVSAQSERLQLDAAATQVSFTLGDVLHTVHGTFKVKSADLWVNPGSGHAGGKVVVDARSGNSGSGMRDGRMHKNVLESERYPEIIFAPDRFSGTLNAEGDSTIEMHGVFTIHGATHEIVLPVKTHIEHGSLTAAMAFKVPYAAWGMKNPSTLFLKVSDTVDIEIQARGMLQ